MPTLRLSRRGEGWRYFQNGSSPGFYQLLPACCLQSVPQCFSTSSNRQFCAIYGANLVSSFCPLFRCPRQFCGLPSRLVTSGIHEKVCRAFYLQTAPHWRGVKTKSLGKPSEQLGHLCCPPALSLVALPLGLPIDQRAHFQQS